MYCFITLKNSFSKGLRWMEESSQKTSLQPKAKKQSVLHQNIRLSKNDKSYHPRSVMSGISL